MNNLKKRAKNRCYFIISCARSGSTSLTKILDTAQNGMCLIEPMPNLNWETREMMEGRITDPVAVLEKTIFPRVYEKLQKVEIYGDKNLTYGPFISHLYQYLKCKFVFIKRDGRDVVRSLINWHNMKFGDIYRECKYIGQLSATAVSAAANLPIHLDTSDYSRPRPLKGEFLYAEWETLSRAEMCAYYWATINELYLRELKKIPRRAWITIDYTNPTVTDIKRIAKFCKLKGLDEEQIKQMLNKRINSLEDRNAPTDYLYPEFKQWTPEMINHFQRIAGKTMKKLEYQKK